MTFQPRTAVISRASSRSPCSVYIWKMITNLCSMVLLFISKLILKVQSHYGGWYLLLFSRPYCWTVMDQLLTKRFRIQILPQIPPQIIDVLTEVMASYWLTPFTVTSITSATKDYLSTRHVRRGSSSTERHSRVNGTTGSSVREVRSSPFVISTYINTKISVCLFVCSRFSRPFRNQIRIAFGTKLIYTHGKVQEQ